MDPLDGTKVDVVVSIASDLPVFHWSASFLRSRVYGGRRVREPALPCPALHERGIEFFFARAGQARLLLVGRYWEANCAAADALPHLWVFLVKHRIRTSWCFIRQQLSH